jgi:hypothetical protein
VKSPTSTELFWGLYIRGSSFSSSYDKPYLLIWLVQTLSGPVTDPSKLPKWNYDGSSTGQAPGEDSEVIL